VKDVRIPDALERAENRGMTQLTVARRVAQDEPKPSMNLREVLNFAWRRWQLISVVTGVSLLIAVAYLLTQVPRYTASALVLLDPRKERTAGTDAILSDFSLDLSAIASQIEIVRSSVMLRRVVNKERLTGDPEFGSGRPAEQSFFSLLIFGSNDERARQGNAPVSEGQIVASVERLKAATTVNRVGQGYIIAISVTSTDPARAAHLANAIADAFIVDKLDARFEAARRASGWLNDRLDELRRQLRESEEAVAEYRAQKGLVQSAPNVSLNERQLADLNTRLVAARAERAERKARLDLVREIEGKGDDLRSLPDLVTSPLISSLRGQAAEVSRREADLVVQYGNTHPAVVNIRAQKRDIERGLAAEARRVMASVKNEYDFAKAREDAVERTLQEVTGQAGLDPISSIQLRELERTAAVNRTLFDELLQKAKITQEQSTFEAREARVISPALAPGSPSSPQKVRVLAVSLILGLALGVGAAFAVETLNAGFTTPAQIEEILELPLLTSVSHLGPRDLTIDGRIYPLYRVPALKPLSRFSEAMRALRSGIQMTDVDHPPKVILFTSTLPDEGKTALALSFAASAAASGLKVLFIDGDLRHPSASRNIDMEKASGLVDLLTGEAVLQDVVRYDAAAKLWLLPAGSRTQNPADLLGSERMKSLMESLRTSFDQIVIDSPPVGPVIDPVVVSQLVDKAVLVVRWAATARDMVQRSVQQLSGHQKVAGVAFNFVADRKAQKYGQYAHYYGSSYYKNYFTE